MIRAVEGKRRNGSKKVSNDWCHCGDLPLWTWQKFKLTLENFPSPWPLNWGSISSGEVISILTFPLWFLSHILGICYHVQFLFAENLDMFKNTQCWLYVLSFLSLSVPLSVSLSMHVCFYYHETLKNLWTQASSCTITTVSFLYHQSNWLITQYTFRFLCRIWNTSSCCPTN